MWKRAGRLLCEEKKKVHKTIFQLFSFYDVRQMTSPGCQDTLCCKYTLLFANTPY